MNIPTSLSLEEELQLRKFSDLVQRMSREQAQEFLIELHRQMMLKDKMIGVLLSKNGTQIKTDCCNEDKNRRSCVRSLLDLKLSSSTKY